MEWKTQSVATWLLVGGSLTVSGCITPGLPYLDPPGFSSTYHHLDLSERGAWQPASAKQGGAFVAPATYYPNTTAPIPDIEVQVPDPTALREATAVRPHRSVLQSSPHPKAGKISR